MMEYSALFEPDEGGFVITFPDFGWGVSRSSRLRFAMQRRRRSGMQIARLCGRNLCDHPLANIGLAMARLAQGVHHGNDANLDC